MLIKLFQISFFFSLIALFLFGCTKDKKPPTGANNRVRLTTSPVKSIGSDSAIAEGEIISDGGDAVSEKGFCIDINRNPTIEDVKVINGDASTRFNSIVRNLQPNTVYYCRVFLTNAQGTFYGAEVSFRTAIGLPRLQTNPATDVSFTNLTTGGTILNNGGATINDRGVVWSVSTNLPTVADFRQTVGAGQGNFSLIVSGLNPATTYYLRAYARNSIGVGYGNVITVKTLTPVVPILTTNAIQSITAFGAIGGGNISSDGGTQIIQRGICWNTTGTPTIANLRTADGQGLGSFNSQLANLQPNVVYFVRAYASNSAGVGYGQQLSFRTLNIQLPAVLTSSVSSILSNSAVGSGSVTAEGGAPVTNRGICWGTSPNPTINNFSSGASSGLGSFNVSMLNLLPGTLYYARAFATNSGGTSYGTQVSFTTLFLSLPIVTTQAVTSITQSSAWSGGNVTSDGNASVTQRGICWSTSQGPTINNSRTINGGGTGTFSAQMTGLTGNRTYYVRAYATNALGTAYGQEFSFSTPFIRLPTISTRSISSITQTSAFSGGNITDDGGGLITQRGICWSRFSNPTINDFAINSGSGTGLFSAQMSGLSANTLYYVRAYAVNSAGISYGQVVSFSTLSFQAPTVVTSSVSNIGRTIATCGGNVTADGGQTVSQRGICWSTSPSPTIANSRTINGSGLGTFTSSLTGLIPGRLYYVRAYATNSQGTSYGSQVTFFTNN